MPNYSGYISQIGGEIPSDILYDHVVEIPFKWDQTVLNNWLIDYNDQRKGWNTIYPDMGVGVVRVMFDLEEDMELFNSTFDFKAWDASQ